MIRKSFERDPGKEQYSVQAVDKLVDAIGSQRWMDMSGVWISYIYKVHLHGMYRYRQHGGAQQSRAKEPPNKACALCNGCSELDRMKQAAINRPIAHFLRKWES